MSDKGKTAAIEVLRREVGFGCPVCRSPFLTWHHFDPPEHVEQHWRAEGIIAMCLVCHADADEKGESAGAYSIEELRAMKDSKRSSEDVKGLFPTWQDKERLLVRVGGCYTDTFKPIISVNEIPQITLGKNAGGLLSLSFELRNKDDVVLLKMEDNWLTAYPANVHDMIVPPKTKAVKVWLAEADVGLDFSFKRITMANLDELLRQDWEAAQKVIAERKREWMTTLPPEQRQAQEFIEKAIREHLSGPIQLPPGVDTMPEHIRESFLAEDKTG
jgi:hypothetical protein